MAKKSGGIFTQLAFTKESGGGGPTGPLTSIQSAAVRASKDLIPTKLGTATVETMFEGSKTAEITVTSTDLALMSAFEVGQRYTGVALTEEAAVEGNGVSEGDAFVYTISKAIVTAVELPNKDNANKGRVATSVTFRMERPAGDSADPTFTIT